MIRNELLACFVSCFSCIDRRRGLVSRISTGFTYTIARLEKTQPPNNTRTMKLVLLCNDNEPSLIHSRCLFPPRPSIVWTSWTEYVGSRWYRAPEMLAGSTDYGVAVDVWACACLAAEMSSGRPLFPGEDEGELVSARWASFQVCGPL